MGLSNLPGIDVFISTADPEKEHPLVTANNILSVLATEYPVDKLAIYVSDDGAALLTFEAMAEAASFAEIWVPFCRKHCVEPRNPDSYFNLKVDPTKNKKQSDFVKDRRWIKHEYDEFKVRINGLPESIRKRSKKLNSKEHKKAVNLTKENGEDPAAAKSSIPNATWMADGTHWPGTWKSPSADHSNKDHAGILQIMVKPPNHTPVYGNPGDHPFIEFTSVDIRVPMLVYVSREKRPGYDHNKKPGAMNAQRGEGDDESQRLNQHPDLDIPERFGNSSIFLDSIAFAEFQGRPLADHPSVKNGRPPGALLAPQLPSDALIAISPPSYS